jgi:hypothetical protein
MEKFMIYQTHTLVRDDIGRNTPVSFVEIGVYEAEYSLRLLKSFVVKKAWFIDSWEKTPTQGYAGHSQEEWNEIATRAKARIAVFPNTQVLHMSANAATKIVDDESLDFVYIDGSHYYERVIEDINLWTKKVRLGGWVTGDDFPYEGVEKAVYEFMAQNPQFQLIRTGSQWLFKKISARYTNTLPPSFDIDNSSYVEGSFSEKYPAPKEA